MPKRTTYIGTLGTIVALLATFSAGVGGYYDVKARGEQTAASLQLLRERQDSFEKIALTRWSKVDDMLSELLSRGIRNETKIDAILAALHDRVGTTSKHTPDKPTSSIVGSVPMSSGGTTQ